MLQDYPPGSFGALEHTANQLLPMEERLNKKLNHALGQVVCGAARIQKVQYPSSLLRTRKKASAGHLHYTAGQHEPLLLYADSVSGMFSFDASVSVSLGWLPYWS
jgi:hypothetical protein